MTTSLLKRLAHPTIAIVLFIALLGLTFLFRLRSETLRAWASCPKTSDCAKLSLDGRYGYSPEDAHQLISRLGDAGRQMYALSEMTLDVVYPLSYSLLMTILLWLVVKPEQGGSWRVWLTRLPVLGGAMDLCENVLVTGLLLSYPQRHDTIAALASWFGILKWTIGIASFGAIVIFAIIWLILRRRI